MLENIVFDVTLENLKYKLKMCGVGTNKIALVFQMQICIIYNIFEFKLFWYSNEKNTVLTMCPISIHNSMSVIIRTVLPNSS